MIQQKTNPSPHPALRLRHTLLGHTGAVYRMALSPDGRILASPSDDGTIRLWNTETGQSLRELKHGGIPICVAWSPDDIRLASGGGPHDKKVSLWDATTGERIQILGEHNGRVSGVAWSPDGKWLASGSDDGTIRLWDPESEGAPRELRGHTVGVEGIAWSPDGQQLCSGAWDGALRLWDMGSGETIRKLEGYKVPVSSVTWSPDGRRIALGSHDRTIRIWAPETGRQQQVLEGHTTSVVSVAFLGGGHLLASLGENGRLILWRTDTWAQVMQVDGIGDVGFFSNLAAHPTLSVMAVRGASIKEINIWVIDFALLRATKTTTSTVYVNAKAVLLGDSGVGKSGLGIRIAEKEFRKTESTHGAQFWHFTADRLPGLPEHIQAELTLWDLAGQPEYRLTHQLFLDDADAALLLFDCSDANDPFRGAPYWAKVLKKRAPAHAWRCLVSSRSDVSPVTVDQREINHFLGSHGLDEYHKTSAATGEGVTELFDRLMAAIPWDQLPRTSTPRLFQVIREFLLEQKQQVIEAREPAGGTDARSTEPNPQSGNTDSRRPQGNLIAMDEIRREVGARFPERAVTQPELDTVVTLLQSRGLVHRLTRRPGEDWILLKPERINQYGAAIIQAARNHPKEIGAVTERAVLTGALAFTGFERLPGAEERIVLAATTELLLQHNLCFREMGYLVFPSQISVTRVPPAEALPRAEIAYRFSGAIETIYASLVVRLSYTDHFRREDQWRYAVEFSRAGHRLGFSMQQVEEGTGEIEIYFQTGVSEFDRVTFIRFITDHLRARGVDIQERIRLYCPNCDEEVTNRKAIERRVAAGKLDIPCQFCDTTIVIPEGVEEHYRREPALDKKQRQLADLVEKRTAKEVSRFRSDMQNYRPAKNKQYLGKIEKISVSKAVKRLKELGMTDMDLFHKTMTAARTANAERLYVATSSRQFSDIGIRKAEYLVVATYILRASAKELGQLVNSDAPVVYANPELAEEYWLPKLSDAAGDDGVILEIEL